jgi:hypothetical protein
VNGSSWHHARHHTMHCRVSRRHCHHISGRWHPGAHMLSLRGMHPILHELLLSHGRHVRRTSTRRSTTTLHCSNCSLLLRVLLGRLYGLRMRGLRGCLCGFNSGISHVRRGCHVSLG